MEDFDPLNESQTNPIVAPGTNTAPAPRVPGQEEYLRLIDQCQALFKRVPTLTSREVDAELEKIFETVLDLGAYVGVSRISIPLLRDCCGGKRTWPDEPLGWGLGDIVRRITRLLGFKNCGGCERRRVWLNNLFKKRS